jgi:predicted O-linked N-acetylglucosamine transferase (SPINDLY family)
MNRMQAGTAIAAAQQERLQAALQHIQAGRPNEAQGLLEAVLAEDARNPDALHLLGLVHHQAGQHPRALALVSEALGVAEPSPLYWNTRGGIERALGRLDEASRSYGRAAELAPRFALAHANLGAALLDLGRNDEAATALRRALEIGPPDRTLRLALARALLREQRHDEAAAALGPVLALNPGDREARLLLEECRFLTCDWSDFDAFAEAYRKNIAAGPIALLHEGIPPAGVPGLTRADQLALGRIVAARAAKRVGRAPAREFARTAKPKLRLGYLLPGLREHSVAVQTAELFELHDRARFDVLAYSIGPADASPLHDRLGGAFDRLANLRSLTFAAGAERIAQDGIDILVGLSPLMEVLALRPAPVQVNFAGYPCTLGADFADYIVADRFVVPPEHAGDYAEALAYLPDCCMPNDRQRALAPRPARAACGLPAEGFVFCCFNTVWKITPRLFELWMGLLGDVPGSVLWLRDAGPPATRNLRAAAEKHGLGDRLVFAPRVDAPEHLARLGLADLFLDTLPFNARATARDALWAGLPVLTCVGDTFAARIAGSALSAAGMAELITGSLDEYRTVALRLARDREVLGALREKLAAARASAPLFDTPRFVRHLETLYQRMWARHVAGERPAMIDAR